MKKNFETCDEFMNFLSYHYILNRFNQNVNHKWVIKFSIPNQRIIEEFLSLLFDLKELEFRKKEFMNYMFFKKTNNIIMMYVDIETYYSKVLDLKNIRKKKLKKLL